MANIILTKYCNLKCPYCFASEMLSEADKKNITLDELHYILKWLQQSPQEKRIGLIGGEPTLHPQFSEILNIINNFCEIENKKSILFTNGIYLKKYLSKIGPKMSILININDPNNMTQTQYNNLIDTLDALYIKNQLSGSNSQATLGCNLCPEIQNYDFFWNIIKQYKIQKIRVSVTTPPQKIDKEIYYNNMKTIFLNFVKEAKKNHVLICLDCNNIPLCYFSLTEIELIKQVCFDYSERALCEPCIDITPDFQATCCFGTYDSLTDCSLFKNCDEMRNYFIKETIFNKTIYNNTGKCQSCSKFLLKECQGGCLHFSTQ